MQGRVAVSLVHLLHDFLTQLGLDSVQVLGEERPADDPVGLEYIPIRHWVALLDRGDRAANIPAFGLALGASIRVAHLGVVGYLSRNCATVGQALNRMNEYQRLVYEWNRCHMQLDIKGVVLEWGTEAGRPGALADECALAIVMAYGRDLAGAPDLKPVEVRFVNPEPPSLQPYLNFFQCPVSFNSPKTVLRLSYLTLMRRIPKPEPTLLALMELQARERLNRLPPANPLQARLQDIMANLLPEGKVTLTVCASKLHCAPRTLQRRLMALDLNFQTLLDDVRIKLADTYMADRRIKLAEVALMLGYADQAAFTHAFTRLTGMPPARWRARLHDVQAPGLPGR